MTLESALIAGIVGLATAVAILWRHTESGLKKCDEDRRALWLKLVDMSSQSCARGDCSMRKTIVPADELRPMEKGSLA